MGRTRAAAPWTRRPGPPSRAARLAVVSVLVSATAVAGLFAVSHAPARDDSGPGRGVLTAPQRWSVDAANRTG